MVALVPVSSDTLARLVAGEQLDGPVSAYGASPLLRQTFDLSPTEDEEAERTALQLASLDALLAYGRRLVVVVDSGYRPDPDGYLGQGVVPAVRGVEALVADAPEAADAARLARREASGKDLDEVWELGAVQRLLAEHELLWFGAEEAASLLSGRLVESARGTED